MKLGLKFSLPSLGLSRVFRFPPQRYWEQFLAGLFILAALVLAFDIWVFSHFAIRDSLKETEVSSAWGVMRESLDAAYARAEEREANFKKYRAGFSLPDPAR